MKREFISHRFLSSGLHAASSCSCGGTFLRPEIQTFQIIATTVTNSRCEFDVFHEFLIQNADARSRQKHQAKASFLKKSKTIQNHAKNIGFYWSDWSSAARAAVTGRPGGVSTVLESEG